MIKLDLTSCPAHECSHVSFITNFNAYAQTYWCSKCTKYFSTRKTFHVHQKDVKCSTKPKVVYRNNIYDYKRDDIYQYLERQYELFINNKITIPYFIVYDFESILAPDDIKTGVRPNKSDPITTYTQEHQPVSCSVFSNIPGYNSEPKFFLNKGDTFLFIYEFVNYLREMKSAVGHLVSREIEHFKNIICNHLKIDEWEKTPRPVQYRFNRLLYVPVISFNGQKYDLQVIKNYLFSILYQPRVIKKGNAYMCVFAENLKFLDMCNYLQAGTSYRQFLQAFNATQEKGFFPYSWLTSLDVLNETKLPSKDKFYNDLHDQPISNEDYLICKKIWKKNKMKTMVDYLRYYNNCDVVPFVESIETMVKMYRKRGVNLFQDAMSLPGVSLKLLFSQTRDPYLCPSNEIEYKMMSDAVIGGPSVIFSRLSECGKTYIKPHKYPDPKICKNILGLDANALYLYCIGSQMPSGLFKHRVLDKKNTNQLKTRSKARFYKMEVKWLMCMEKELGVPLITSLSAGSQQRVMTMGLDVNGQVKPEMLYVDGYYRNPITNERIVCELYGCYHHSCLICYGVNTNRVYKYYKTIERENKLKALPNVRLITLWEHDYETFMNGKMTGMTITRFQYLESLLPPTLLEKKKTMAISSLVNKIKSDSIFGMVRCSVEIAKDFHPYYCDFPPIYKIVEMTRDKLEGYMKEYANKNKLLSTPQKMLFASMFAHDQVFITPQLKWFYDQNKFHNTEVFKIFNITEMLEFNPKRSFKNFMDQVTADRMSGDTDPSQKIQALISKNIGNASYGKTILNKEKLFNIKYVDEKKSYELMNDPSFIDINEIHPDLFEMKVRNKTIYQDLPKTVGGFVYAFAKLHMVSFYYDFINKFLDPTKFELLQMDTDSLYMALAEEKLADCVKNELKPEFDKIKDTWLANPAVKTSLRQPGLFKTEFEGVGYVGLNSKSYFCLGKFENKIGCKGVQKTKRNKLSMKVYKSVLFGEKPHEVINKGFKSYNGKIYTYAMKKNGLQCFYAKRKVLKDKVHTTTLPI